MRLSPWTARVCFSTRDGVWFGRVTRKPAVTLRFEAYTREQVSEYMQVFKALLNNYPQIDQSKFDAQLKAFSS